jgi:hypothetical protein
MSVHDPAAIAATLRQAYTSGDLDGARRNARLLDRYDADAVLGPRALAACGSMVDPTAWRAHWTHLLDVGRACGESWTATTAAFFADALALDWPAWPIGVDSDGYRAIALSALGRRGLDIDTSPPLLMFEGAQLAPSFCYSDDFGVRRAVWLVDHPMTALDELTVQATLRALRHTPAWENTLPLWLSPAPLPYRVLRWIAGSIDAIIDLEADADPSLRALDENAEPFVLVANRVFGRELIANPVAIDDVAAILERYDDDGLGGITFLFACQIASFLWQTLEACIVGAHPHEASDPRLPRRLRLPDGQLVDLVEAVRASVGGPVPFDLASLMRDLIGGDLPDRAEGHT